MPNYRVRLINSRFESVDEAHFPSLEEARKGTVVTATKIAAESIAEGELTSAVEIQIFDGERLVARQVVALSVTELTTGK